MEEYHGMACMVSPLHKNSMYTIKVSFWTNWFLVIWKFENLNALRKIMRIDNEKVVPVIQGLKLVGSTDVAWRHTFWLTLLELLLNWRPDINGILSWTHPTKRSYRFWTNPTAWTRAGNRIHSTGLPEIHDVGRATPTTDSWKLFCLMGPPPV